MKRPLKKKPAQFAWLALGLAGVLVAGPLSAQSGNQSSADRADLEQRIVARIRAIDASLSQPRHPGGTDRPTLIEHRRRLEALLARLRTNGTVPDAAATTQMLSQGAQTPPDARSAAQQAPDQQAQATAPAPRPVGEAPPVREGGPQVAQIFETPGVLTPPGSWVLEPALQYVRNTDNRVALVGFTVIPAITVGLIDIRRTARDSFYGTLTTRYGVTKRFEVEAKLPYVYTKSSTVTRPLATPSVTDSVFDADGSGIGDIELAGRYQLNEFRGDNAVFVGSMRMKFRTGKSPFDVETDPASGLQKELPTGTGFFGLQPGVTALIPSDPAVFFGGLSYLYSVGRDVGNGFGRIRPGHVFDFNMGMGLALNEKASFSIGYQHSVVGKSRQADPASATKTLGAGTTQQLGTLRFGTSYRTTPKTTFNFSLGIGVTKDSPDLELTVRVPYSL